MVTFFHLLSFYLQDFYKNPWLLLIIKKKKIEMGKSDKVDAKGLWERLTEKCWHSDVRESSVWDGLDKGGFLSASKLTVWMSACMWGLLCVLEDPQSPQPYPKFCFLWSATCRQMCSENIKWKIPETNNVYVLNCVPFLVAWWNLEPSYNILRKAWIIPLSRVLSMLCIPTAL